MSQYVRAEGSLRISTDDPGAAGDDFDFGFVFGEHVGGKDAAPADVGVDDGVAADNGAGIEDGVAADIGAVAEEGAEFA